MRSNFLLSVLFCAFIAVSTISFAQEENVPGLQIRSILLAETEKGTAIEQAAIEISQTVLDKGMFFDAAGLSYLTDNSAEYQSMVALLNNNATGFEIAIAGFGEMPEKASEVVTIAILMFPEESNDIYNIAVQMQVISEEDALLAVINAGVDPSTLTATAAGVADNAFSPLGVGTGAAGAGGGDTTVSAN